MRCENLVKKPGGKVLKIEAIVENGVIKHIELTGDFFAHPEELLEELESMLRGVAVRSVEDVVEGFKERLTLVGISFGDVIEAIKGLRCHED